MLAAGFRRLASLGSYVSFYKISRLLARNEQGSHLIRSAVLQLLQQLFRLGLICKGDARAEQGLECRLSIGRPTNPVQGNREVILDVRVAGGRKTGCT